jgi:exopolysaccharide biosynthesis protein
MTKVLIFCFVVFCVCLLILSKIGVKYYKKYKEAQKELEKQKRNSAYLATHAAEIARIERSSKELKREVKNAKTDTEIADIINAVIDSNNKRLQND